MTVRFVDLVAQYESIRGEVHEELEAVMSTAGFVLGKAVKDFEAEFARFCCCTHCVGVASGTDALHLALRALDVGPGDEVITAANTFIATVNAISYVGATPVLVDVNEDDYLIDVGLLEQAVTDRTKAIIPVHLYGQPVDMDPLLEVARRHNLWVIEDACQAHGSTYRGKAAGSMSDIGCFSFYPGKNLGAYGDGGAVATDSEEIAERIRVFRNCGSSEKYVHPVVGYNSRLDSLQAAVLKVKLKYLAGWNEKRRQAAAMYSELLAGTSLVLPQTRPEVEHVWHLYVVQHERRDALMQALNDNDIQCGIHYPIPIHEQQAYSGVRTVPEGVPVTARTAKRIVSLPMHPDLTEDQIRHVADTIREFDGA